MSTMHFLARQVAALQPGQRLRVCRHVLREVPQYHYNGVTFTSSDRVLENVIGSAYGWGYTVDLISGDTIFWRSADYREGDPPTYRSPDRRGQHA